MSSPSQKFSAAICETRGKCDGEPPGSSFNKQSSEVHDPFKPRCRAAFIFSGSFFLGESVVWENSCSQCIAGAALHGEGAGGQRFFEQRLDLGAQAGLAVGEQAESFDCGTADDVGWIVIKRHEEAGSAQALGARVRDAGNDESEVGAGAPVVACLFRSDLAEESEQSVSV